jgi:hypothetical protein
MNDRVAFDQPGLRDLHQQLAQVLALEQAKESGRRILQALERVRISTSLSAGSGIGRCASSKLSRLGAPSAHHSSMTNPLMPALASAFFCAASGPIMRNPRTSVI